MRYYKNRISADEEIEKQDDVELLFEVEDVVDLVSEIVDVPVEVDVDGTTVTLTVGEDEYVVEPEGTEEFVEACKNRQVRAARRPVKASATRPSAQVRRPIARRPVQASRGPVVSRDRAIRRPSVAGSRMVRKVR